ncbi:Prefoldin subunit 2 [Aphelenchoides besseyi]|nr:Prefoldin subunit 2 [Aphelenchoides besseyi]
MTQPTKEQQKIFAGMFTKFVYLNSILGFKKLREEQQILVSEITRYSSELRETQSVLSSINKWDNTNRKFFYRAVDALLELDGTQIVEKLSKNVSELEEKLKVMDEELKAKATELQEYTEKHKVRIVAQ